MSDHQQWIPVDDAIYGYINEAELSEHKFFKLWHLAFDVMTELGLDFFYQIKSVKLPINENLTVNLPADFLQWTKVGVLNDRGETIPMAYNDKLTTYASGLSNRLEKTQDNTLFNWYNGQCPVWYNYWNGAGIGNVYGIPSGQPKVGTFKVDSHAGIILLDENFQYSYIMLEYTSSPKEGDICYIPIQFKPAMIAGLAWLDIRSIPSKTHVNNANLSARRHEFYNQRRLGWARYKPFSLQQAYEWSLQNQRMSVKA